MLTLGRSGRYALGFTLHLRAPDPSGRARAGSAVVPEPDGAWCSSWVSFDLRADRLPREGVEERVVLDPPSALLMEDGAALRRCLPLALRALPSSFVCLEEDREGMGADEPWHPMAWLELSGYRDVLAVVGYYALGFGAAFPFGKRQELAAMLGEL